MEPESEPGQEQAVPARAAGGLTQPLPRGPVAALRAVPTHVLCAALLERLREPEARAPGGVPPMLGKLEIELGLTLDHLWNRFSRTNNTKVLQQLRISPGWRDEALAGATCVELGCGALNPLGGLLPLLALGAECIVGIDLEPVDDVRRAARALYVAAAEMIAVPASYFAPQVPPHELVRRNLARCDLGKLSAGDPAGLPPAHARVVHAPGDRTGLPAASVDIATSVSFLEHVGAPQAVLAELARITKPGGLGVHRIDGRDHRSYRVPGLHPLAFLHEASDAPLVYGCNRLRPLEYVPLFERAGFAVLAVQQQRTIEVTDALRDELAEPFRRLPRETLEVVGALLCVRRA